MNMTYELESSQQGSIAVLNSRPGGSSKGARKRVGLHVLLCDKCAAYYFSDETSCPACERQRGNSSSKSRRIYSLPCSKCGARYLSDEASCSACGRPVNSLPTRPNCTDTSPLEDGNGKVTVEREATVRRDRRVSSPATTRERLYGMPCEKCGAWYFSDEPECPFCENRRRETGTSAKPARLYGMPCEKCGAWYFTDERECPNCESRRRESVSPTQPARLYGLPCTKCGAWYYSDESKCPVCGTRHVKPKSANRTKVRHIEAEPLIPVAQTAAA